MKTEQLHAHTDIKGNTYFLYIIVPNLTVCWYHCDISGAIKDVVKLLYLVLLEINLYDRSETRLEPSTVNTITVPIG